jgi:hypothetical protein
MNCDRSQLSTFTLWVNHQLRSGGYEEISDLISSFRSGVILHHLLEVISERGDQIRPIRSNPRMKIQELENLNICLDFLRKDGVHLVNIDATDIWSGREGAVMGLVWRLIRKYQLGSREGDVGGGEDSGPGDLTKEGGVLINWLTGRVNEYGPKVNPLSICFNGPFPSF